ncbi:MAG: hypothetical protein WBB27_15760, partial [Maribacter sp.]
FKSILDPAKKDILRKKELANAKSNAMKLCKISGTTLGDIVSISESSPKTNMWNRYYNDYEEF